MKYLLGVILSLFSLYTYAQDQTPAPPQYPGAQPDLPGTLMFDFGSNLLQNTPENMNLRTWPSRSINISYLYPIQIGDTRFSIHPGLGLGFEKFTFSNNVTLNDADSTQLVPLAAASYGSVRKTQLAVNYLDIPIEFRFFSKENYRGFMIAIGGKVGRRIDSFTKINFEQDGERKMDKLKREYNLNPWRYGLQARVGFRGFNLLGYYALSDLFENEGGPQTRNYTVSLSIALF